VVPRRGRGKSVCARGAHRAWSCGPSTSPLAAVVDAQQATEDSARTGLITPIGWSYVVLGVAFSVGALLHVKIGPLQMGPLDMVSTGLLVLAGVGAILRARWGRWLAYAMSAILLLGIPIGTILGALMIYHLTIHRDQFKAQNLKRVAGS